MKKLIFLAVLTALSLMLIFGTNTHVIVNEEVVAEVENSPYVSTNDDMAILMSAANEFKQQMIEQLQARHADDIHLPRIQKTLKEFKRFVMDRFPQLGEQLFGEIVGEAFPQYAQAIFDLLTNLSRYDAWYTDHLIDLSTMSFIERDGLVWQKRREIFGALAEELWADELDEKQARQAAVKESLALLDQAYDTSLSERLYILQSTIDDNYMATLEGAMISKSMVSNMYFTLDSVQHDLKVMENEQRQQTINDMRREMGFSEQQVMELAKVDQARNLRWNRGYDYMKKREALTQRLQGEELTQAILELQQDTFQHEAKTIAAEEAQGFMRFERPRIYGRN